MAMGKQYIYRHNQHKVTPSLQLNHALWSRTDTVVSLAVLTQTHIDADTLDILL